MLILLGPSFSGGDDAYQRLAFATGMMAYDLRSRIKPGIWGLLKVLADAAEAERLAALLQSQGFPVVTMPREVATDAARPIVALKALEIDRQQLTLHLHDRTMVVPFAALAAIVRGEAQVGKSGGTRVGAAGATSSSTFRAVVPSTSELQVFRESPAPGSFEAFAAADLHFHSVTWIARIDARGFDFHELGIAATSQASALDTLADRLALLAQARVDRASRASSVASFAQQAGARSAAHASLQHRAKDVAGDERFDPYSRIIGEAERLLARSVAARLVAQA